MLRQLGPMSVARFMRSYWQRQPVLIEAALPSFVAPISREQLFEWAGSNEVESRLVTSFSNRWKVKLGPIARLPSVQRAGWTLLVQGVDLLDDSARALLSRFRFLPDARLDDLMVSYASDGGGVGPHVDSYDVFLLQAQGRRRWRISRQADFDFQPGLPLRLLKDFRPEHEWVLGPGDMLYLPPGIAHEGSAVGPDCMTFSIGFRAPSFNELMEPWFADFAEHSELAGRYTDRGAEPVRHPARLPDSMTARVHARLLRSRPARPDTERFLLSHLSDPKPRVVFEPPRSPLSAQQFHATALRRGVRLDRRTRLLYARGGVAINGDWSALAPSTGRLLHRLGDRRALAGNDLRPVDRETFGFLHAWYCAGWIHLGPSG